jgi:MFS family permease
MADGERQRFRSRDFFDLLLIGFAHSFSDGYTNLLVPVLVLIVSDFGLSDVQVGILLGSYSLSSFLFVFPVSLAADHGGRKLQILMAGLAVASLAYISMLGASVFSLLVGLAFLAGAGNSVYHPCGTAITAERFPAIKPYAISVHGMMGNIGTSVIPILLAFVAEAAGWRWAIAICTLPVIILIPLLWIRYRDFMSPTTRDRKSGSLLANSLVIANRVFRDRNVLVLALTYALSGMGSKSSIGFLPLLATRRFGFRTASIGLFMSLYFGMGIVSKPLMGFVYARLGPRPALGIPLLLSAAATLAIGIAPWPTLLILLVAVVGVANPISPAILTAAADFAQPGVLASSVGLIYSLHAVGFVAPVIGGWIAAEAGLPFTYMFAAVLFLAGGFLIASIRKEKR